MKYPFTLIFCISFISFAYSQQNRDNLDLNHWQTRIIYQDDTKLSAADTANATTMNRLAGYYRSIGSYEKAESLYRKALLIRESQLDRNHPELAVSLNNLALLQKDMGNYETAENLYLRANQIIKETSGINSIAYATSLNNLATLYRDFEQYRKAEPLYIESLTIFLNLLGDRALVSHGIALNNTAVMFRNIGNLTAAEPLQNKAIEIIAKSAGKHHPSYAGALNNMAMLNRDKGKFHDAEIQFLEALNIQKKVLGINHPSYSRTLGNIADFYYYTNRNDEAESYYNEANIAFLKNIEHHFGFLSEKEKELYLKTLSDRFDMFNSFSLVRQNSNPSVTGNAYNNILKTKGLLLNSGTVMRNAILSGNNDELIKDFNEWIGLKQQIAQLSAQRSTRNDENVTALNKKANELEKKLVRNSAEFSEFDNLINKDWQDIKAHLNTGEAAIEFTHFKHNRDSIVYCALLLKHDSNYPLMIPLFEENELAENLKSLSFSNNNHKAINDLYDNSKVSGRILYEQIWQPIDKHLKGVHSIYISTSGLLHKISFAAISKYDNRYLLDDYNIHMVSTTAQAGTKTTIDFSENLSTLLFGGIQYSITTGSNRPWPYLKGTLEETLTIRDILDNITDVQLFSDTMATVEIFKKIAPAGDILHIATHGFFFPEPNINKPDKNKDLTYSDLDFRGTNSYAINRYVNNNDPLMRSGLVFSGVNDFWTDDNEIDFYDDGVLTAFDVVNIDLRKSKLVVMSACNSGLGDIVGNEGVYGLQRAFKMAGTDNLIISLWQIPDKETAEFMKKFYTFLIYEGDIYKAFTNTQHIMRQKYDPFFWAGFVFTK